MTSCSRSIFLIFSDFLPRISHRRYLVSSKSYLHQENRPPNPKNLFVSQLDSLFSGTYFLPLSPSFPMFDDDQFDVFARIPVTVEKYNS